ncbi:enkurin domain-containing protein 1-like [Oscarella lobularis]|uniref:enkurin domain-containing protein 1-like n=1 Tax=Oscarella lobularis TaxID=121494 RepID=UPI0033139490
MAVATSWTIPTAPEREKSNVDAPPRSRTRPEAQSIADLHVRGTVHLLFHPEVRNPEPRLAVARKKDHIRANVSRMRQIQAMGRKRHDEATTKPLKAMPATPPRRSEKYSHVESKVAQRIRAQSAVGRPLSSGSLNRPNSACGSRSSRDFVSENAQRASQHRIRRSPSVDHLVALEEKKKSNFHEYKRGVVPQYLLSRQHQWAKEEKERRANAPDPMCPPGHVLMSKAEQSNTLKMLEKSKMDMLKQLQLLPVGSDSLRVRTRKSELENKLVEIDDAIKVFSRPKVFVKDE